MDSWFLSTVHSRFLILGLAVLILGVALLYFAWRQPKRQWSLVSLGWIALLLVHWPLGLALGLDRGWAIAAILPGFVALLWLGMVTPWRQWNSNVREKPVAPRENFNTNSRRKTAPVAEQTNPRAGAFQLAGQILVIGLLSLAAALGVGAAMFSLLDTSIANRTIYAALMVIVLWPILMVWSKAAASLVKPAIYFVGMTFGGLLLTPLFY